MVHVHNCACILLQTPSRTADIEHDVEEEGRYWMCALFLVHDFALYTKKINGIKDEVLVNFRVCVHVHVHSVHMLVHGHFRWYCNGSLHFRVSYKARASNLS